MAETGINNRRHGVFCAGSVSNSVHWGSRQWNPTRRVRNTKLPSQPANRHQAFPSSVLPSSRQYLHPPCPIPSPTASSNRSSDNVQVYTEFLQCLNTLTTIVQVKQGSRRLTEKCSQSPKLPTCFQRDSLHHQVMTSPLCGATCRVLQAAQLRCVFWMRRGFS